MNSKVAFIIGSVVGVGIGVAGTYSYFKDKYEKPSIQEEYLMRIKKKNQQSLLLKKLLTVELQINRVLLNVQQYYREKAM